MAPKMQASLPHHFTVLMVCFHRSCDSKTASKRQHGCIIDAFMLRFQRIFNREVCFLFFF